MDLDSFLEGPLLQIVFIIFIAGIGARLAFFFCAIRGSSRDKEEDRKNILTMFLRLFLPFHSAVIKKPLYALPRYIFHLCLFAVPVWYSGHIILWEESRFGWEWSALPDIWADGMTIVLFFLATCFLIRHVVVKDVRNNSSPSDYIFIILVALPFMTGYFLAHGTLGAIPFIGNNMGTIHILSGEVLLLFTAFLFVKSRLNKDRCIGCASCELSCPTGTLESHDKENRRIFNYSHYQCINCGACVNTCPEEASELRHEISPGSFFQISSMEKIRSIDLKACERCGRLFSPLPQMDKIDQMTIGKSIGLCKECKKVNLTDSMFEHY